MGSLIPVIDLNLLPDPPATITDTAFIIPKIEPKLEPFDELFNTHQTQVFSTPTLHNFTLSDQKNTFVSQSSLISSVEDNNVYSEFRRVSDGLGSSFAQPDREIDFSDPNSRAIVPILQETQVSSVIISKKRHQRSGELVRVSDLTDKDHNYFRDTVRRTRMIYESLRIIQMKEERHHNPILSKRLRADLRAATLMRDCGLWINCDKRIVGSIPGVCIGDFFLYRMELCVVGLHGKPQAGIDYLPASQSLNGEPVATSIIVSGGYEDDEDSGDVIIYTGQGGQDKFFKQCENQKLECGNLALERSMRYGIEVRVIRGIKYNGSVTGKIYVYDGLYKVHDCWFDVGKSGFGVYKYKILRIEGQGEMGSSILRFAESLRIQPLSVRPSGYLSLDLSLKKENVPIFLFNDIDNDHEPLCYEYLVRTVFPPFAFQHSGNQTGCKCISFCGDDCLCALKNGGEFAYDHNEVLLRGKPLIFECGTFCKCPPHCRNRVTQNGLKNRLEVFRSRETGWGVRSLDMIHAGTFICEYTGVVLTMEQAQVVSMNGDSLIYPNRFPDRWAEWGDLSQIYSDYVRPSYPSVPPLDFAMDVSKMRNVACYVSHSTAPNVLVQSVLYDHNNLMFPHLMLFAMENIPPLRELSLDYGVVDELTGKLSICN